MSKNDSTLPKYFDKAKDFIKEFEGFSREKVKGDGIAYPYYDSKGIPTIGYGFNLMVSDVCNDVVREILDEKHKENNPFDIHKLTYLNLLKRVNTGELDIAKISSSDFNEKNDVDKISNIIFASLKTKQEGEDDEKLQTQIQKRFDDLLLFHHPFSIAKEQAEKILEKRLKEVYISLLDNSLTRSNRLSQDQLKELKEREEYVALLSFAYINVDKLIGAGLRSGLKNNNRFKAWFEIRYNSNKGKDIGIAKRRFAESNVFGLFENTKRGEYSNTANWGFVNNENTNKAELRETIQFFISLHSKFEKEECNTYFEYVKHYESGVPFGLDQLKDIKEPKDFTHHYKPYKEVFSPFVNTFNEAMKKAIGQTNQETNNSNNQQQELKFTLENILVVTKDNRTSIIETINEKAQDKELAIILEKEIDIGFYSEIVNPKKVHLILAYDNHIDCLGFESASNIVFYVLKDNKIIKLCGCKEALEPKEISFQDTTLKGLMQINQDEGIIYCFKEQANKKFSPNLSIYCKDTFVLLATIYNLRSEGDNNA